MKKGFTLPEVLGVITILALLVLLVTPAITKTINNQKQNLYNLQIEEIERSAKNYMTKHLDLLPEVGDTVVITLGELKQSGMIDDDIRNPITKELFSDDLKIEVRNSSNQYIYKVLEENTSGVTQ